MCSVREARLASWQPPASPSYRSATAAEPRTFSSAAPQISEVLDEHHDRLGVDRDVRRRARHAVGLEQLVVVVQVPVVHAHDVPVADRVVVVVQPGRPLVKSRTCITVVRTRSGSSSCSMNAASGTESLGPRRGRRRRGRRSRSRPGRARRGPRAGVSRSLSRRSRRLAQCSGRQCRTFSESVPRFEPASVGEDAGLLLVPDAHSTVRSPERNARRALRAGSGVSAEPIVEAQAARAGGGEQHDVPGDEQHQSEPPAVRRAAEEEHDHERQHETEPGAHARVEAREEQQSRDELEQEDDPAKSVKWGMTSRCTRPRSGPLKACCRASWNVCMSPLRSLRPKCGGSLPTRSESQMPPIRARMPARVTSTRSRSSTRAMVGLRR